ncbi:hypothetical protein ACGFYA_25935 [Streptomyces sp. NPDC048305]|uniref:hypothetical protein n=1 Tax=Streptomyces sp. NPDC048305 TaxID=3365532 RepID=UPI0037199D61
MLGVRGDQQVSGTVAVRNVRDPGSARSARLGLSPAYHPCLLPVFEASRWQHLRGLETTNTPWQTRPA